MLVGLPVGHGEERALAQALAHETFEALGSPDILLAGAQLGLVAGIGAGNLEIFREQPDFGGEGAK